MVVTCELWIGCVSDTTEDIFEWLATNSAGHCDEETKFLAAIVTDTSFQPGNPPLLPLIFSIVHVTRTSAVCDESIACLIACSSASAISPRWDVPVNDVVDLEVFMMGQVLFGFLGSAESQTIRKVCASAKVKQLRNSTPQLFRNCFYSQMWSLTVKD